LAFLPLVVVPLARHCGGTLDERGGHPMPHPTMQHDPASPHAAEVRRATERGPDDRTSGSAPSAAAELRPLVAAAAALAIDDRAGWIVLRVAATERTERLARTGVLPAHLVVRDADPPVLVARTLAAAWRRVRGRG
jgi:hypothetical protein